MKNKRGFTLIELLAVIVILGILMLIAIPSVTKYIDSSKKETYIKTITNMVDVVKYGLISENSQYTMEDKIIKGFKLTDVELEKGKNKTPYGNLVEAYSFVVVTKTQNGYTYQVQVLDSGDYGIKLTNIDDLKKENIEKLDKNQLYDISELSLASDSLRETNTIIEASPTLTTSSNNTTDESGLYTSTDTNSGKPTYYFRGNIENNYVDFAGHIWRIVRINEDGSIRLIMNDAIDNNKRYQYNSSYSEERYMYYDSSNAKKELETWYKNNLLAFDSSIGLSDYCGEFRVRRDMYQDYVPTFKCGSESHNYKLKIGLITYDEVVYAGGYYNNYNDEYYLHNSSNPISTWTMSPAGMRSGHADVWKVFSGGNSGGYPCPNDVNEKGTNALRPVINLKSNTILLGRGTRLEPYIVY